MTRSEQRKLRHIAAWRFRRGTQGAATTTDAAAAPRGLQSPSGWPCVSLVSVTMDSIRDDVIIVGKVPIPFGQAEEWVRTYTDVSRNEVAQHPYAYPAYDGFDLEHNDPDRISDADLLAPVLLNVRLSLRAFHGLQRVRPALERALANPMLRVPLREFTDADCVADAVGPLYEVLDGAEAPVGVLGTTLSKVLHRKRPQTLVLHDIWVRSCYVGREADAPVPKVERRSWAEYMSLVSTAIGRDLSTQRALFDRLGTAAGGPGEISDVRLLDILAWMSKGKPSSEAATD